MIKRLPSCSGFKSALYKAGIVTFMMLLAVCMSSSVAYAQQGREVQGTVKDTHGNPVAGAAVVVSGTTNGVTTDVNGNFKINLNKSSAELVVSFIGYEAQNVAVQGGTSVNVVLNDSSTMLDEAVVVGYGVQRRATITGSVANIKGEEMMQSPQANLTNSLAGRMPGIFAFNRSGEPGKDYAEILIRGKATTGNTQPLFVIDGVAERWGNIDRLNPSDIESITVLKDASAAIYGSRSANGVILVTTKRGSEGNKPTITYDGSFSLSQNTRAPKLMNAYEYMVYHDEVSMYLNEEQIYKDIKEGYRDGSINTKRYGDTDWMKVVFEGVAPKTEHSVSVRGGNDQVKYYVSGGLLYQTPVYKDTNFNFRTTQVRSNIDAKITKDLTLSLDLAYRQENRHDSNYSTGQIFWEAYQAHPYLYDYFPWSGLPGPGIANGLNVALMTEGKTGYYKLTNNFFNSKIGVDLKMPWITQGLSLSAHAAFDNQFQKQKLLFKKWDAYEYDDVNDKYTNLRENTGDQGRTSLWERNDRKNMYNVLVKLNYDRRFGDHSVSGFLAYEQSKKDNEYLYGKVYELYSTDTDYLFAGDTDKEVKSAPYEAYARQHYFGRLNYAYKDRYMVEFTLRNDGSSNFPRGKRRGWFPGASVGWRVSEEPFMKNVNFIHNLKLRASVGLRGNDDVPAFQYLNSFYLDSGAWGPIFGEAPKRVLGSYPGRTPNYSITWEKDLTYNVAIESSMFNGMLDLTLEYFYSKRKDILAPRTGVVPAYAGMWLPDENVGKVDNYGMEAEAMFRKQYKNSSFYIGGTLTFARNEVVYMAEAENTPHWRTKKGRPLDSYLLYKTDGINKDGNLNIIDVSGEGNITEDDKIRSGYSYTPELVYGIMLGGTLKQIGLNVLFQGQGRGKTFVKPQDTRNFPREFYKHRWISETETPNAKYPRAFTRYDPINGENAEVWLKSTNFLRLKNVELSYTFNKKQLEKMGLKGFRVYLSGSNLFVIDKIKIMDPETDDYERKGYVASGMGFPVQRMYNIGVNISF